jgi:hypothetical protein
MAAAEAGPSGTPAASRRLAALTTVLVSGVSPPPVRLVRAAEAAGGGFVLHEATIASTQRALLAGRLTCVVRPNAGSPVRPPPRRAAV